MKSEATYLDLVLDILVLGIEELTSSLGKVLSILLILVLVVNITPLLDWALSSLIRGLGIILHWGDDAALHNLIDWNGWEILGSIVASHVRGAGGLRIGRLLLFRSARRVTSGGRVLGDLGLVKLLSHLICCRSD